MSTTIRSRPVHMPSQLPGQAGYAMCGVQMRRVGHTTEAHHTTCHKCIQQHAIWAGGFTKKDYDAAYGWGGQEA